MIVCDQCDAIFEPPATYCNRCGADLNEQSSSQLFDNDRLQQESQLERQLRHWITVLLIAITATLLYVALRNALFESPLLIGNMMWTLTAAAIAAVASILNSKKHRLATLVGVAAGIAIVPMVMFGTLAGCLLLGLLFIHNGERE